MDVHAVNVLSLFSGIGGLDLGVRLAISRARTVCFVEGEAYCCEVLASRMEEGLLDEAPIWSDVVDFDGLPWRDAVDLVIGGFPCQDISTAGKRAGLAGAKSGLWAHYLRVLKDVEPVAVFIENVGALRSRGLDQVLEDLAEMGYDAEWGTVRAESTGAPHKRERLFILAHSDRWRRRFKWNVWMGSEEVLYADGPPGPSLADSGRERVDRVQSVSKLGCGSPLQSSGARAPLVDANIEGLEGRGLPDRGRADECSARAAGRPVGWPPGPDDTEGWIRYLAERPDLEPSVCGGADGPPNRVDRLRALGNAVVPQQAALALSWLHRRACGLV